jgi:ribosomal-protein-alanine N-acetyltransferase
VEKMKLLETKRLILRNWKITDLDDLYEYSKNPNVGPRAGWKPHKNKEVSKEVLQSFIKSDEIWAIVYKENNKVIGSIGNHKDVKRNLFKARMIGYVLSEEYWGKGIMIEAVKRVIKYLFEERKYELVSCYHYDFNCQSKRVIEKCGFRYEGILRMASELYDGRIYDDVCYSMTREEYYDKDIFN